ncbi:GntR family transcriptional regulator [Clostridium botulinum CFSAN002369]|nr:GntR family transcriptional regulator [Clostridium botulinum CFSAN002369]
MTASGPIVNSLIATKCNSNLGSSLLTQKSLLPFIQLKFYEKHLKNMNSTLLKNQI